MGEKISTREAYGRALEEFGADEKIYVFDSDLKSCTMTAYFAEKYPSVMDIYYEDENFVCYYFEQDAAKPYDLGMQIE